MTDGAPIRPTPIQPTLATLRVLISLHGPGGGDQTVAAARHDLGDAPDPGQAGHALRMRAWLNQWGCRMPYPRAGQDDLLAGSLAAWWAAARDWLPPDGIRLASLTDVELDAISWAYASLYQRAAAVTRNGGLRTLGPTAAAKLLYFLRPEAIAPWDKAISAATGGGSDGGAFRAHLTLCREWAGDLEAEGQALGLQAGEVAAHLGRPSASVARLIDEWLYATVTAGYLPVA